jgi:hypothetical protein
LDESDALRSVPRRLPGVSPATVPAFQVIAGRRRQDALYRRSGGMALIGAEKRAWTAGSTGRCLTLVLGGSFPR